jgi:hypothetical protein
VAQSGHWLIDEQPDSVVEVIIRHASNASSKVAVAAASSWVGLSGKEWLSRKFGRVGSDTSMTANSEPPVFLATYAYPPATATDCAPKKGVEEKQMTTRGRDCMHMTEIRADVHFIDQLGCAGSANE